MLLLKWYKQFSLRNLFSLKKRLFFTHNWEGFEWGKMLPEQVLRLLRALWVRGVSQCRA